MTNNKMITKHLSKKERLEIQSKKGEEEFKKMVKQAGCSEQNTKELWKWFDNKEKKGVAVY